VQKRRTIGHDEDVQHAKLAACSAIAGLFEYQRLVWASFRWGSRGEGQFSVAALSCLGAQDWLAEPWANGKREGDTLSLLMGG
jgi:hypothetical protein